LAAIIKMKKFTFLLVFVAGCACSTDDEVKYTRSSSEAKLVITHRNNCSSFNVEIKNADEAKKYKERLQKLVKEIERYEEDVRILEK